MAESVNDARAKSCEKSLLKKWSFTLDAMVSGEAYAPSVGQVEETGKASAFHKKRPIAALRYHQMNNGSRRKVFETLRKPRQA